MLKVSLRIYDLDVDNFHNFPLSLTIGYVCKFEDFLIKLRLNCFSLLSGYYYVLH